MFYAIDLDTSDYTQFPSKTQRKKWMKEGRRVALPEEPIFHLPAERLTTYHFSFKITQAFGPPVSFSTAVKAKTPYEAAELIHDLVPAALNNNRCIDVKFRQQP